MPNYSPLKTLRVQNFQSISDATIELGRLTILVGPGDAGKSAILRALRAAVLNDGHDDDISHEEKRCQVTLTFQVPGTEGPGYQTTIEWWKDKGKGGCYRWEEQEFTKTGGRVPEEIAKYLGFGLIDIDAITELTPQLSDQFDAPFILHETGSKRARILGKATRLDTVVTGQMKCKKVKDETHREAEKASATLIEIEEQLAALPDYDAFEAKANGIGESLQVIDDSLTFLTQARELADKIAEASSRATAVDTAPLLSQLDTAEEALKAAVKMQTIARELPPMERKRKDVKSSIKDHKVALASFEEQYVQACLEAGVCQKCGGLLSHKECAS